MITSIARGEVVIAGKRLAELEAKERAHDDYVAATRMMLRRVRQSQNTMSESHRIWQDGFDQAFRDYCKLVVDVAAMRNATEV